MRAVIFLRAASVVSALFAVGHSLGAPSSWSPIPENDVLRGMRSFRFEVMGTNRTYLELYVGLGLTTSVFLFLQAVLLWQLASIAKVDGRAARPLVAAFLLASLASTVIAWKYIFIVPAVFGAVITVCIAAALLTPTRTVENR